MLCIEQFRRESSAPWKELAERTRSVQKSAESTSIWTERERFEAWTGRSTGCFRHRLACYPAGAGGYGWHRDNEIVDATPLNPRALTVIVYLNPDWDDDDGGALRFYDDKHSKRPKLGRRGALAVSPEAGTAVVFDSFHGHEVLPSKRRRYALTLWLFHEPLGV